MKVIISHDVDHLTVAEHVTKDLIIPKFIVRSKIEFLTGKISFIEFYNRIKEMFSNKWNGVDEVLSFNKEKGFKSTFFFGMDNALGLSYNFEMALPYINKVIDAGFETGVHGIEYVNASKIKEEYLKFKSLSKLDFFGIRMHYLRHDLNTFSKLEQAGYLFDATDSGFKNPYKIGKMWEFPLQIMDGWVMDGSKRWQTRNLMQAKEETLKLIDKAVKADLKYLSILFHDRYFSKSFETWLKWYVWLIEYLAENDFIFCTHQEAINELNKLE